MRAFTLADVPFLAPKGSVLPTITATGLGGNSRSGGSSSTITLTGLTIPQNALVLVMVSCGLTTANTTTCACTNITFDTLATFDNTTPTPDRLTRIFRGVAGASAGSTITATLPSSTTEAMIAAIYITGAPTTNNGADAIVQSGVDSTNPGWTIPLTGAVGAVVSFGWIFDSDGSGIFSSDATATLVDHSPGSTYSVAAFSYNNGDASPTLNESGDAGGQGMAIELAGLF